MKDVLPSFLLPKELFHLSFCSKYIYQLFSDPLIWRRVLLDLFPSLDKHLEAIENKRKFTRSMSSIFFAMCHMENQWFKDTKVCVKVASTDNLYLEDGFICQLVNGFFSEQYDSPMPQPHNKKIELSCKRQIKCIIESVFYQSFSFDFMGLDNCAFIYLCVFTRNNMGQDQKSRMDNCFYHFSKYVEYIERHERNVHFTVAVYWIEYIESEVKQQELKFMRTYVKEQLNINPPIVECSLRIHNNVKTAVRIAIESMPLFDYETAFESLVKSKKHCVCM